MWADQSEETVCLEGGALKWQELKQSSGQNETTGALFEVYMLCTLTLCYTYVFLCLFILFMFVDIVYFIMYKL